MRTFDGLLRARSKEDFFAQALDGLQGRGVVYQTGLGTGTLTLSGLPTIAGALVVEVVTGGALGTAVVHVSTDGGSNYGSNVTLPSNGVVVLAGTGVTLTFANGAEGGDTFVEGDTYTATLAPPSFAVTAWQPGSVPRKLLEVDAEANEERDLLDRDIAAGGYLEFADPTVADTQPAGPWLKLLARSRYNVEPKTGTQARGIVVLTDTIGSGPFTFAPGDLWVASTGGKRYTNVTGGTLAKTTNLAAPETLSLYFAAEGLGSEYNAGNGTVTTLITTRPGVTVTNPAIGTTGTWLTVQGTDPETQGQLRARCMARWPSLGAGRPEDAYMYGATTASTEVTRVRVVTSPTVPGEVDVYLAGSAGPVSSGVVSTVQTALNLITPLSTVTVVAAATAKVVTVSGTVKVKAAQLATAQATAEANLAALFSTLPIGGDTDAGTPGILDLSALIAAIAPRSKSGASLTGVVDLDLTAPTGDTTFATNEVATLTNSLTWVGV